MSTEGSHAERFSPAAAIAVLVRSRREALGWSMRELAQRAGVSQPFVSKLEHAQLLPSVQTIYALAAAFGTSPANLLPVIGTSAVEPSLHIPATEDEGADAVQILAGGAGAMTQVYSMVLQPGVDEPFYEHAGEEIGYVVEGAVRAEHGDRVDLLDIGAALSIDPLTSHRWSSSGDRAARLLLICADPSR